jgi:hypothetical protein
MTYEEFHYFYSSPNIIMFVKSRMMIWVGHSGDEKFLQNFCRKIPREETVWEI